MTPGRPVHMQQIKHKTLSSRQYHGIREWESNIKLYLLDSIMEFESGKGEQIPSNFLDSSSVMTA